VDKILAQILNHRPFPVQYQRGPYKAVTVLLKQGGKKYLLLVYAFPSLPAGLPFLRFPVRNGEPLARTITGRSARPFLPVYPAAVRRVVLLKKQAPGSKTAGFPVTLTAFPACFTVCSAMLSPPVFLLLSCIDPLLPSDVV
jgi:hypothetical protein